MNIKKYGYTCVNDIHPQIKEEQIKQYIQDELNLFIDINTPNQFSKEQYTLLKRILRKKDVLYISSLNDLGETKSIILREWIYLIKKMEISVFVLEFPIFQENQNLKLYHECILQLLYWLSKEEESKTSYISINEQNFKFPPNFLKVYKKWKNKEISTLMAMRICHINNQYFHQLVKRYEDFYM
ncbi:hypothetical protein Q0N71_30105 [Bacillus thuringiensis]|uniref:hypothetical protein n=1 Tax=Bacillus thuringiensis TaxID=1428 RepID=UPI003458151D